jgi:phenylalanyl-tRNA synthetase alpha chain
MGGTGELGAVVNNTGLKDAAVMRAALTLHEKNLVALQEKKTSMVRLREEGRLYAERGLPERRLIEAVLALRGRASVKNAAEKADLKREMLPIVIGWIRRKGWARIYKTDGKLFLQALKEVEEADDEKLLRAILEKGEISVDEMSRPMRLSLPVLKTRGLIEIKERTSRELALTQKGWRTAEKGLKPRGEVSELTPELITSGRWREVKFRRYNIRAPVAKIWPGKKQPYNSFLDELKRTLVELGFKEMAGPVVELMFFNCDSLFMPQDHPAREIHDIYFVKSPTHGNLNAYQHFLQNVKKAHENGWKTGSKGWRYQFSLEEARRLILRSHGTALSARTLMSPRLEIPGKYFSIVRCYRPEVTDRAHLTEFNQVEGIVVSPELNLRDLLGVLERFAVEIAGADKVRFRPDYFPFTEPSVELLAYKEGYGWLEFGGSGIFRPELTEPLGVSVPVIAWGLGVDRLFMMKTGVDDIRYLFTEDLEWIRKQELL